MGQRSQGRRLDTARLGKQPHSLQALLRAVIEWVVGASRAAGASCFFHIGHPQIKEKGPAPYSVEPFSVSYLNLCFPNTEEGHSSSISCPSTAFCFRRSICSRSNCAMLFSGVGRSSGITSHALPPANRQIPFLYNYLLIQMFTLKYSLFGESIMLCKYLSVIVEPHIVLWG